MRSGRNFLALAIMFFIFAIVLSMVFWAEVSLAAKIGLYALGFGSGIMAGQWIINRDR